MRKGDIDRFGLEDLKVARQKAGETSYPNCGLLKNHATAQSGSHSLAPSPTRSRAGLSFFYPAVQGAFFDNEAEMSDDGAMHHDGNEDDDDMFPTQDDADDIISDSNEALVCAKSAGDGTREGFWILSSPPHFTPTARRPKVRPCTCCSGSSRNKRKMMTWSG
jgi:hypothetical protein